MTEKNKKVTFRDEAVGRDEATSKSLEDAIYIGEGEESPSSLRGQIYEQQKGDHERLDAEIARLEAEIKKAEGDLAYDDVISDAKGLYNRVLEYQRAAYLNNEVGDLDNLAHKNDKSELFFQSLSSVITGLGQDLIYTYLSEEERQGFAAELKQQFDSLLQNVSDERQNKRMTRRFELVKKTLLPESATPPLESPPLERPPKKLPTESLSQEQIDHIKEEMLKASKKLPQLLDINIDRSKEIDDLFKDSFAKKNSNGPDSQKQKAEIMQLLDGAPELWDFRKENRANPYKNDVILNPPAIDFTDPKKAVGTLFRNMVVFDHMHELKFLGENINSDFKQNATKNLGIILDHVKSDDLDILTPDGRQAWSERSKKGLVALPMIREAIKQSNVQIDGFTEQKIIGTLMPEFAKLDIAKLRSEERQELMLYTAGKLKNNTTLLSALRPDNHKISGNALRDIVPKINQKYNELHDSLFNRILKESGLKLDSKQRNKMHKALNKTLESAAGLSAKQEDHIVEFAAKQLKNDAKSKSLFSRISGKTKVSDAGLVKADIAIFQEIQDEIRSNKRKEKKDSIKHDVEVKAHEKERQGVVDEGWSKVALDFEKINKMISKKIPPEVAPKPKNKPDIKPKPKDLKYVKKEAKEVAYGAQNAGAQEAEAVIKPGATKALISKFENKEGFVRGNH